MSIKHHPTDETLGAYAAGNLDEGSALVVAAHVSLCPRCAAVVRGFEEVGGALLDRLQPSAMSGDALKQALARLDAPAPSVPARNDAVAPEDRRLPPPLLQYELGPWRRIGMKVEWRSVGVPTDNGSRVFMLRAAPGTRLPHHRHTGTEWTCVFEGAFRHELGRYGAGDFDEADESVEHHPTVEDGAPCVCLVAMRGGIALQSWLGRLAQPFVRL